MCLLLVARFDRVRNGSQQPAKRRFRAFIHPPTNFSSSDGLKVPENGTLMCLAFVVLFEPRGRAHKTLLFKKGGKMSDAYTLYSLGKTPRFRSRKNRETWELLESLLNNGPARYNELTACAQGHDHEAGGEGFVKYCFKNDWIIPVSAQPAPDTIPKPTIAEPHASPKLFNGAGLSTGIYMAYPTTEELKPTYRGHKSFVNCRHTKIGITKQGFEARRSSYHKTFDGEVAFRVIAEVPPERLDSIERKLLTELRRRYPLVGTTREWFHTDDRQTILRIVNGVLDGFAN